MLKIINIVVNGTILSCTVLAECDENRAYHLVVDMTDDFYPTIESDFPKSERTYEGQARMALFQYHGKGFPETITSVWY